jgi:hypothetical protein
VGGGIAGASIGLNVALQVSNNLSPELRQNLTPSLFAGSIAVGLVGGAVSGYFLGRAAREGWAPGKVAVLSIWAAILTAGTVAVAVLLGSLMGPRAEPGVSERNPGPG